MKPAALLPALLLTWTLTLVGQAQAQARDNNSASDCEALLKESERAREAERQKAQADLEAAKAALAAAQEEINEIRRLSGKTLALDEANRKFTETLEMLRAKVDLLEAENHRLKDGSRHKAFLYGACAVFIGALLTLLTARLWPRKRPIQSTWS